MRATVIALSAGLFVSSVAFSQDTGFDKPKLLLTTQRLRRLERDRTRQTMRWANFETRVNTVPDSPERGFELALFYAVTHDEKRGREAVDWALAHRCSGRQVSLIVDWCRELLSPEQKAQLTPVCAAQVGTGRMPPRAIAARDVLFSAIATGQDASQATGPWKKVLSDLQNGGFSDAEALYPALEYLAAVRATRHTDLREDDPKFFAALPVEFLLSLRPAQVQHPDWMTHIAALALVELDPNLESSQFLQGWALEDAQMIREGPGVAYELLWADPYLPGVGYENLDPWTYDTNGRLFARTSWNSDACWVSVSSGGAQQENCPAGWESVANQFGHLTLVPMRSHCTAVPHRKSMNDVVILWKLQPHQKLFYLLDEKKKDAVETDAAGMWRMPENVEGNVCTSLDKLKRP